ncbi:hypothetical protein J2T56_002951 [Natronobacillus azotifigens]|uniref:FHA domain-containing protein n=1 Tax=Natronobacillus azotifigens TaxID=472978 RepID=A0A9J6RFW9_9BACI|nr:hypothetical protein [Natronobacillus azotifigens]MCZ0704455.1 hypothetical protein [Natronobacillus azotifigens]
MKRIVTIIFLVSFIFAGCSHSAQETEVIGAISHGILDENTLPLINNDNLIEFDYQVLAEGVATNVGFLVFLDGIPQEYSVNNSTTFSYLHNFTFDDHTPEVITFQIKPITDNKNRDGELCIVSIINPYFNPNNGNDTVGVNHNALETILPVRYENSPMEFSELYQVEPSSKSKKAEIDSVEVHLSVDPHDMGMASIISEFSGQEEAVYRSTFFVNHRPVGHTYEIDFSLGFSHVIKEIHSLKEQDAVYSVSVPSSILTQEQKILPVVKTKTIFFMEDENLLINGSNKTDEPEPYSSTSPASLIAEITDIGEKHLEILEPNVGLIHIPRSTPVYVNKELVNNYDFKKGEKIEVLYNGLILETYPLMLGQVFQVNIIR